MDKSERWNFSITRDFTLNLSKIINPSSTFQQGFLSKKFSIYCFKSKEKNLLILLFYVKIQDVMTTQVIEGTWEEVARHAENLVGRKVRLLVLEDDRLPKPNHKALEIMQKIEEKQKDLPFTAGESSVDIVRRGRSGEMFNEM
jgi:hypothetical protein